MDLGIRFVNKTKKTLSSDEKGLQTLTINLVCLNSKALTKNKTLKVSRGKLCISEKSLPEYLRLAPIKAIWSNTEELCS